MYVQLARYRRLGDVHLHDIYEGARDFRARYLPPIFYNDNVLRKNINVMRGCEYRGQESQSIYIGN